MPTSEPDSRSVHHHVRNTKLRDCRRNAGKVSTEEDRMIPSPRSVDKSVHNSRFRTEGATMACSFIKVLIF